MSWALSLVSVGWLPCAYKRRQLWGLPVLKDIFRIEWHDPHLFALKLMAHWRHRVPDRRATMLTLVQFALLGWNRANLWFPIPESLSTLSNRHQSSIILHEWLRHLLYPNRHIFGGLLHLRELLPATLHLFCLILEVEACDANPLIIKYPPPLGRPGWNLGCLSFVKQDLVAHAEAHRLGAQRLEESIVGCGIFGVVPGAGPTKEAVFLWFYCEHVRLVKLFGGLLDLALTFDPWVLESIQDVLVLF